LQFRRLGKSFRGCKGIFQVIYIAKFEEAVYTLHAFQKNSKNQQAGFRSCKTRIQASIRGTKIMSEMQKFASVWDALEDDPIKAENLKLRSVLTMAICERIRCENLKQEDAVKRLNITQPRVSALLNGKIESFRLDTLVDMAHRLGFQVTIDIAV
jgi:predicted XRE-type DNA-binding protein